MNHAWVICVARSDAALLAPLRLIPGIEVAEAGGRVWLRGKPGDEKVQRMLLNLPAVARYEAMGTGQLRATDARIPSQRLPELKWQPIAEWLQVESPVAAMPAIELGTIALRLVRSAEEVAPDLLMTTLKEWSGFVNQAPGMRLERLQFAADVTGKVLVRGTPLPPLPGRRFIVRGGIAVPVGFTWEPAIDVEVLARRFGISGGAVILWHEDGTTTRFHPDQFVAATRSAARMTAELLPQST